MICDDSLCADCAGNASVCLQCKTRAALLDDGTCECSTNSADNGAGECACSPGYDELFPGVCSECRYFV